MDEWHDTYRARGRRAGIRTVPLTYRERLSAWWDGLGEIERSAWATSLGALAVYTASVVYQARQDG